MSLKQPKRVFGKSPAHQNAPHQEERAARRVGGRKVQGSGSGHEKGDARRPGLVRVECKTTAAESFRVTREMIDKLEAGTFGSEEVPVLEVEFVQHWRGSTKPGGRVYVVPAWAMDDLLERLCGDN